MYILSTNDSLTMTNVSTDFVLNNLHSQLYGSTLGKLGYFFMACLMNMVVGPILLSGITVFEVFSGDPQKRNVINRLMSLCSVHLILLSILIGCCQVWRGTLGLIDVHVMTWIEGVGEFLVSNVVLFYDEMTILRFLYIVVWKRVVELDDKLWTIVLCVVNYSWSFCLLIINRQFSAVTHPFFKKYTGGLSENSEEIW